MDNISAFRREIRSEVRSLVSDALYWLDEHYSDPGRESTLERGIILEGRAFLKYATRAFMRSPEFAARGYKISTDPSLKDYNGSSLYNWYHINIDDFFGMIYRKVQREEVRRRDLEANEKMIISRPVERRKISRTLCEVGGK